MRRTYPATLRAALDRAGLLSLQAWARKARISSSLMRLMRSGLRPLTSRTAALLADAIGVPPSIVPRLLFLPLSRKRPR